MDVLAAGFYLPIIYLLHKRNVTLVLEGHLSFDL